MGILLVYDVTSENSFNSSCLHFFPYLLIFNSRLTDIRTWHANIEQHASEGVNKILIGNKSDWTDKKVVTEEQGRELAAELGIKFMETSAKANDGVEEAFFTLARFVLRSPCVLFLVPRRSIYRDIKTRLIDSQGDAPTTSAGGAATDGSVRVNQQTTTQPSQGCC